MLTKRGPPRASSSKIAESTKFCLRGRISDLSRFQKSYCTRRCDWTGPEQQQRCPLQSKCPFSPSRPADCGRVRSLGTGFEQLRSGGKSESTWHVSRRERLLPQAAQRDLRAFQVARQGNRPALDQPPLIVRQASMRQSSLTPPRIEIADRVVLIRHIGRRSFDLRPTELPEIKSSLFSVSSDECVNRSHVGKPATTLRPCRCGV